MTLLVISVTQLKDKLVSKVIFIKSIVTHIFLFFIDEFASLFAEPCGPYFGRLPAPKATLQLTEP